ncbi:MAG: YraN family protein [Syntrophomonadaceae bacterium]|jgi:putative endonuclease|nr:YraN family protein [Syntrophomonadaceae bacterium]
MRKRLGFLGEEKAASYLTAKGYKVIERNYHTRYGEIDIICTKGNDLFFTEVKTRTSLKFGYPEEAITAKKIDHLKKAALLYINSKNQHYRQLHFDVITILIKDGQEKINHIKDAF